MSEDATDAPARENDPERFDRLPATATDRAVEGRATRREVVDWWVERFGVPRERFSAYSFWEKGSGKVWAYSGAAPSPTRVETLGMVCLRTRQEHWKPTTDAVQRFAADADRNVIDLTPAEARRFVAGEDQDIERWDGDWGYLVAAHEVAGERAPIGVGLYTYGELKSMVPKGRRRDFVSGDAE
jgi:NOL1/NOP2/fmu family ribosome biogenesis protein